MLTRLFLFMQIFPKLNGKKLVVGTDVKAADNCLGSCEEDFTKLELNPNILSSI